MYIGIYMHICMCVHIYNEIYICIYAGGHPRVPYHQACVLVEGHENVFMYVCMCVCM